MKRLKKSTVKRIMDKGCIVDNIKTPKGIIKIWHLCEKRGYQTNFKPKTFKYAQLPVTGKYYFFSLTAVMKKFWAAQGWITAS